MATQPVFPSISITFAPAWWRQRYGMTFDAHTWQDPIARTERDRDQRRLLYDRFGDAGLGERDPLPHPVVGGEYGDRFMAALWRCEIIYLPDQAPAALILKDPFEGMLGSALPDVEHSPLIQRAYAHARLLQDRYGTCAAAVNYGGPLNNAVSVFGEEIIAACVEQPELAQRVLRHMGAAVVAVHDHMVCRVNGHTGGPPRGIYGLGNCPVCMLGPRTYREVVLPIDRWLRDQFTGLHLHHCGVFDTYAVAYQPLRPLSLDLGPGSDLRLARTVYPHTPLSAYIDVGLLKYLHRPEIDMLVKGMIECARPVELFTHIRVADVGPDMPDDTIRELLTVAIRLANPSNQT